MVLIDNFLFRYLGKISYSIYMIHSIVWAFLGNVLIRIMGVESVVVDGQRVLDIGDLHQFFVFLVFMFALIVFASISNIVVEARFRKR